MGAHFALHLDALQIVEELVGGFGGRAAAVPAGVRTVTHNTWLPRAGSSAVDSTGTSGSAIFPSDVVLPGMLYGAILRCPHPHARVVSVDTAAARKLPGPGWSVH